MGIFDDKLEDTDCDAQMKPFNLAQLSQMIATLEQRKQGFNDSSVSDNTNAPNNNRLQCPSTPKEFKSFDSLRELQYDGNMLTPKERSGLYQDHTKVILEMGEVYNIFSRCIYFNPEMSEKYWSNIDSYIRYYTNIIRHIDIFLQEDQLMCTRLGFPLVPVLSYLPNMYKLEHSNIRKIDDTVSAEVRRVENEMMVIMEEHQEKEQQNISHNSSFSRIRSEELNDIGYGLSKISPITFDGDAFQTPSNSTQDNALMSTPRKRRNEVNIESFQSRQVPQKSENSKPYNAELSMAGNGASKPSGRFIPLQPNSTNNSSQDTDNSNTTTVYYEKSTGGCQDRTTGIKTSPKDPKPTGTTTATQTSHKTASQAGGTQTMPPPPPKKSTSTEGTQTSPPKDNSCEQVGQGQPECNQDKEGQQMENTSSKGKKNKKSTSEAQPCPGPSTGSSAGPRNNFTSRNIGTGRPTIKCIACGEYSHWRRECPYDNYCTTCNNHDHATHMCRACRQTNNRSQQGQQSPLICVYCESIEHSSSNCCRRPWDNREQPCSTPDSLRRNQTSNSKNLGNATGNTASMGANTHGHSSQSQSRRSNSKNLGNFRPNNKSSQSFRNTNNYFNYRES